MKETYAQMKARHQDEIDAAPFIFAFSTEQMDEALKKRGLTMETARLVSFGAGIYCLKEDLPEIEELFDRHDAEKKQLRKDKKQLEDALYREMVNHECIIGDYEDALRPLGYTLADLEENPELRKIFKKALKKYEAAAVDWI